MVAKELSFGHEKPCWLQRAVSNGFQHFTDRLDFRRQTIRHGGRAPFQRAALAAVIVMAEEHGERCHLVSDVIRLEAAITHRVLAVRCRCTSRPSL